MRLNPGGDATSFDFRYEDFTLEGYDAASAHQGGGGGVSATRCALVLVVAVAENGVIGRDGALPWRLKSDMAHFRDRSPWASRW